MSIDYDRKSPFDKLRNPEFSSTTNLVGPEDEAPEVEPPQVKREAARSRKDALIAARKSENDNVSEDAPVPDRANSVEIELADGSVIGMSKPNIAVQLLAMKVLANYKFADEKMMSYALTQARAVLHVDSINGNPYDRPVNEVEYKDLINRLGDLGVEAVMAAFLEYFPPVQTNEFKIVKKS